MPAITMGNHVLDLWSREIVSRVRITEGMSVKELKERVSNSPHNGGYAETICVQCGVFTTNEDSYTKDAKVMDGCECCIKPVEFKEIS